MLPGYSVWIEIQANKATISDARKFRTAMQHCAEAGVDAVLLSVRDTSGYVLYPSTLAPSYSEYDPTFAPGVDYLRQCLEICRQEGIALYAAMDVFVGGNRNDPRPEMPALRHPDWQAQVYGLDAAGKPCVCPVLQAGSLQTVSSIDDFGELFLDPMNPEVQQYLLDIAGEVLSRYPVQGLVLDRARYVGLCSDFGPLTRQAVEQLAGTAAGWPASVYRIQAGKAEPGPLFDAFRISRVRAIRGFMERMQSCVHRFPERVLLDYIGSWYPLYDQVGANWASPRYLPQEYGLARPEQYQQAGYAPLVDNLLSGCYYPEITEREARDKPAYWYSVEGAARLARQVVMGDTPVTAGLFLDQYRDAPARIAQAIQMCFVQTGRCMLFDLSYLEGDGWWRYAQRSTALQPLTGAELPALHTLLQKALPQSYDLGRERLERAAFHDHAILQTATLCLKRWDGSLLGAVVSKRFEPGASPYGGAGCISVLVVDPAFQKQGWGSCLYRAAEQAMGKLGIRKIFLGQDVCNLFSGVPEPLPEKHAFFKHRGYEMCVDEHYDLEADVTQDPLIDAFDVSGFTSYTAEPLQRGQEASLLAFLQAEFPGRWLEEMQSFLGSGGNPGEIMLLCPKNGAVCGFCKISVNPQGRSGLGPIGISAGVRGRRLGEFLLRQSLLQLRALGAHIVCIDWTILKEYYGKFGFLPVRRYRGGVKTC